MEKVREGSRDGTVRQSQKSPFFPFIGNHLAPRYEEGDPALAHLIKDRQHDLPCWVSGGVREDIGAENEE